MSDNLKSAENALMNLVHTASTAHPMISAPNNTYDPQPISSVDVVPRTAATATSLPPGPRHVGGAANQVSPSTRSGVDASGVTAIRNTATIVDSGQTKAPSPAISPPSAGPGTSTTNPNPATSTVGAPITPLVYPKTVTITFVPDWTQADMQSPFRPVTVSVVLGPAGTLPQHSQFCFEFLLFCEEPNSEPVAVTKDGVTATLTPVDASTNLTGGDSFPVPKGERALLWHANAPFARFDHAVVRSGCRLSSGDELKTVSVALRTHVEEKHPNALVYQRRSSKMPKCESNTGCLRVVRKHHYYLNITFASSSTIAQLVGLYAWRPMIYLTSKRVDPSTGRDSVITSRVFTHFNTNWALGVEHNPDEREMKASAEAAAADAKLEELRIQSDHATPITSTSGQTVSMFSSASPIVPSLAFSLPLSYGATGTTKSTGLPQLALHATSSLAPQQPLLLSGSGMHPAYAGGPTFVPNSFAAAGMLGLSPAHTQQSNIALAQSMMAQLSVSSPSLAQHHQHDVLRAQHQAQQAQLLTQYQIQYQNQQRALQQYQQLQAHQLSLPLAQQYQLQVPSLHRQPLTPQQLAHMSQPSPFALSLPLGIVPAGTQTLQLSSGSAVNPTSLQVADAYRYQHLQQQSALLQLTATGQQKTQAFQHALGPISGSGLVPVETKVSPSKITDYAELAKELKTRPIYSVHLPSLEDTKMLFPLTNKLSFEPSVIEFTESMSMSKANAALEVKANESSQKVSTSKQTVTALEIEANQRALMPKAMAALEVEARAISIDAKHDASDAARHMLSCLSAVTQLVGWQHVSWYIRDSDYYNAKTKEAQKSAGNGVPPPFMTGVVGTMDEYQVRGQALIKRLAQRVEWVLMLLRRGKERFDAGFVLKVIAADRVWAHDANVFMREAESKVTELLVSNQSKFQAFREQQRKGVGWPHSTELRKTIERAGFVYRPMMIKRDRCVCETCGVEVSGWRQWHNPFAFHNYSRHDSTFRPPQPWVAAADPIAVASAITEANLREDQTAAAVSVTDSTSTLSPATSTATSTAVTTVRSPTNETSVSAPASQAMGDGNDTPSASATTPRGTGNPQTFLAVS